MHYRFNSVQCRGGEIGPLAPRTLSISFSRIGLWFPTNSPSNLSTYSIRPMLFAYRVGWLFQRLLRWNRALCKMHAELFLLGTRCGKRWRMKNQLLGHNKPGFRGNDQRQSDAADRFALEKYNCVQVRTEACAPVCDAFNNLHFFYEFPRIILYKTKGEALPGRRKLTTRSNRFLSAVTRFNTWFRSCRQNNKPRF